MVTGELRSQVEKVWNAFWSGGIANPREIIEQITYLRFLKEDHLKNNLPDDARRYLGSDLPS